MSIQDILNIVALPFGIIWCVCHIKFIFNKGSRLINIRRSYIFAVGILLIHLVLLFVEAVKGTDYFINCLLDCGIWLVITFIDKLNYKIEFERMILRKRLTDREKEEECDDDNENS